MLLSLGVLVVDERSLTLTPLIKQVKGVRSLPWGVALASLLALVGVIWRAPSVTPVPEGNASLNVLTYNIQQGYSAEGAKNFDGQLALIRQLDPDVIGLQETDTNRIAGGNADIVRYFAENLNLYSYYGPKSVPGTFGIALLSKYPIDNPRTFYMFSQGEQTATISARITVDSKSFHLFVTHLGNGGPLNQQKELLSQVEGEDNVIAVGDFNFQPDSAQYELTTQTLNDAWLLKWPTGVDDRGVSVENRIDHVFVSPGTTIRDARYILSPASDHPAMTVEIGW